MCKKWCNYWICRICLPLITILIVMWVVYDYVSYHFLDT